MFRKQSTAPWVPSEPTRSLPWVEPYRTQAVHPDVTVPLYQAMISAALLGIALVAILWLVGTQILKLPAQVMFVWLPTPTLETYSGLFLLVFVLATLHSWNQNLSFARSTIMIQRLERIVGHDLDGDEIVGHPMRVNAPAVESPTQKAHREFQEFVLACFEQGTTYAALRGQGWKDPQIDRYATWAIDNHIGRLKGKTNHNGWELVVGEVEALKIINELEWIERERK